MRTALWPEGAADHDAEVGAWFAGQSIDIVAAMMVDAGEGEPVGFIELNLRNFAEGSRARCVPYLEAWYVAPACRGRGYGRALMRQAEQWALAQGFAELASDTDLHNAASIALHRRLGFIETARVVCFLKSLDCQLRPDDTW